MVKPIPYVCIGNGPNTVFYSSSIHANEWITSVVLMKFLEDYAYAYSNNSTIFGYSARELFEHSTLYIVPMCNPDGVDLVTNSFDFNSRFYTQTVDISRNFPDIPFPSGWKANINGVDLENLQPLFYY